MCNMLMTLISVGDPQDLQETLGFTRNRNVKSATLKRIPVILKHSLHGKNSWHILER